MKSPRTARRPKRSRLQRLLRGSVALAFTAVIAVATFPWWAPTGIIADHLARKLARDAGTRVRIAGVTLSWSDGLGIEGLTIAGDAADTAVFHVERVRCDMSPLTLLGWDRPGWVELHGPELSVELASDGTHNLAPLERMLGALPDRVVPRRMSVHKGRVAVRLPAPRGWLDVRVADVQVLTADDGTARVTMSARLVRDGETVPISMALQTGADRGQTEIELTFAGLDIAAAGGEALGRRYPHGLRGRCAGKFTATVGDEGVVDKASVNVNVADLADEAGPIATPVKIALEMWARGPDGGLIMGTLSAPGLAARADATFTAGMGDLRKLTRGPRPDAKAFRSHLRKATTGFLRVEMTGPELAKRFWPALAKQWPSGKGDKGEVHFIVTLDPPGQTDVSVSAKLGRAGDVFLTGTIPDVIALGDEMATLTDAPLREQVCSALRHIRLLGTLGIVDAEATLRLFPPLADELADLPTTGAAGSVMLSHTGSLAVGDDDSAGTQATVKAAVPAHGKAEIEVDLVDLQAFSQALGRMMDEPTRANALACLADLNITGTANIEDLSLFERIGPDVAAALKGARLNGRTIDAWFSHRPAEPLTLRADVKMPPGVELTLGEHFVKPTRAPARVNVKGTFDDETTLTDISARLDVGQARLTVTDGRVELPRPGEADRLAVSGQVDVVRVEEFMPCLPRLARYIDKDLLRGGATAWISAEMAGRKLRRADVKADLWHLAIDAGDYFVKKAPMKVDVVLGLRPEPRGGAGFRLAMLADCNYAWATGEARLGGLDPAEIASAGLVDFRGAVRDAAELTDHSAVLARALGGEVTGSGGLSGGATWQSDGVGASVRLDGTKMAFVSSGEVTRKKRLGIPAEIRLSVRADRNRDDMTVRRADASLSLGKNHLSLSVDGAVSMQTVRHGPRRWHDLARKCSASLVADAAIDATLLDLVPELAESADRFNLAGGLTVRAESVPDGDELAAACAVDARGLAGQADLSHLAGELGLKGVRARRLASMGRLVKPADYPAAAWLTVALPRNLAYLRIDELDANLGKLNVTGSGRVALARTKAGSYVPEAVLLRGQVRLPDVADMTTLLPALKPYRPAGGIEVDFAGKRTDRRDGGTLDAIVTLAGLSGRYRGRDVRLDGTVDVIAAAPGADGAITIGRLRTDGLDVRAAGSHAAVVADLANLPAAPAGSVTLLGESIDAVAIERWLSATGEVAPWPEGRLTPADARALRDRADETVAMLAVLAGDMDIDLRARIARLRARDAVVERTYDVRQFRLDASIRHGRVRGRYATALEGGTMNGRFAVALGEPVPIMSARKQLRGVIGTENMAPQMHQFFPGNTPGGTFERAEASRWPLADIIASQADPRFKLTPAGSAETVTTDGVLEGTAATGAMAFLFPGLKGTTYRYRKMTAFSTFGSDGTAVNDMIFDGRDHGLYMTGTTDSGGRADYDVGLLTLGSLQSQRWQHKYRQGRVPLFRFRAQLYRRKFTNVTVDYYWPHQALGTALLENNILYRMWKD